MDPLGKALHWLVSLIADRLFAGTWLRMTKRVRAEARSHADSAARVERLRSALGVLAEGLAMNLGTEESQVKVSQAINELQTEGPPALDADLEHVVNYVATTIKRTYTLSHPEIYQLMKPIREKVGPIVGTRG